MTLAPSANERPTVLKPYTSDRNSPSNRRVRRVVWLALVMFCLFEGFVFAFLAPHLMMLFIFPFAVMGVILVWALPETDAAPEQALTALFFAFVASLGLWPNYLALVLPGLPWITVARLTGFPLVVVFVICLSVSQRFRSQFASNLRGDPVIWRLVLVFSAIQFVSIVFSKDKGSSVDRFLTAQISWTLVMFIAVFVMSKPRLVTQWVRLTWLTLIPIGLSGVWENHLHHVPWLGHIPSFLKIEDPHILGILYGTTRAGSGIYRVQSTFTTSITLSEYIALILPFIFYYLFTSSKILIKAAAAVTAVFMSYIIYLSNSRSGMVGLIISIMLSVLYWGAIKWRRDRGSLIGPAIVISYPITGAAVLAATFVIGRLHRLVWGGGAYTNSTLARHEQMHLGIPKIISHPWGYGIGQGAQTLGFTLQNGFLTIDNYYLDIALEYGVVGFIVFYGLLAYTIYKGGWFAYFDDQKDPEISFLAPASIALLSFLIIKSVFSQQDNNPIAFMLIGMVLALITRARAGQGADAAVSSQAARGATRISGALVRS